MLPGNLQGLDTKYLIEGPGCLSSLAETLSSVNSGKLPVLLVYDDNTKRVAGNRAAEILAAAGMSPVELLLNSGSAKILEPDYRRVLEIKGLIEREGLFPVAVGSGVINDLVKRAAFEAGIPYLCAATASSVDGYSSFGAALVQDGLKVNLPCTPPAAIVADTDILRAAPYPMTASGYGDLYAKVAAGADWVLADRLGLEKIHRESWDLVQTDLPLWIGFPEKLRAGDPGAFANLFKGLTSSGFAMQIYKDSRPAAGAEHMISHVWEMEHLSQDGVPVSHGFKVALGTVISISLMEAFFTDPPENFLPDAALRRRETWDARAETIRKCFPDPNIRGAAEEACRKKWLDAEGLKFRVERLVSVTPEVRAFMRERHISRKEVVEKFKLAGCPVSAEEFGLSPRDVRDAVIKAQMIRTRYTILDAAYEAGILRELLEEVIPG
jgi:glycerol-1-phosphate dehydrogenase [NAD(P)+]